MRYEHTFYKMIDYRSHSVEDLAADEMFRRWVIDPSPEITCFWNQWLAENPDRSHIVGLARELVGAVQELYSDDLTDEMLDERIREISRQAAERKHRSRWRSYAPAIWKAVAAFVLVSGLGAGYYLSKSPERHVSIKQAAPAVPQLLVRTNNSNAEVTILLSDNSVATLAKGSSIRYPRKFDAKERRVYLQGEAFFDVARNEKQPFLVYTDETVTKVLGTSFRVKASDQDNTVLVAVKTGRVSVFQKKTFEAHSGNRDAEKAGVILTPNQQAVFIRKENRLEKGLVEHPEILSESTSQKGQLFDDKPVPEVLQALQKAYGIQIQYNAGLLANCRINAQFDDENLKQRMNAICQAIGASYEMAEGRIIISSKGCI